MTSAKKKTKASATGRIFLSFAHDDQSIADRLYRLLVKLTGDAGLIFKADEADVSAIQWGTDWKQKILNELHNAKVLIGLVSPRALAGRWLWIEAGIVWARDESCIRLLATPDTDPSKVVPFEHLQMRLLKKTERQRIQSALSDAVQLVAPKPQWDERAKRLLRHLFIAVEVSLQQAAAHQASINQPVSIPSPAMRDEKVLRALLLNLPTMVIDKFIGQLRHGRIIEEIIYFYEGFFAEVSASDFHVFDSILRGHIEQLLNSWRSSLSFDDYTQDIRGGRAFRLVTADEMGDFGKWKKLKIKFDQSAAKFEEDYHRLLDYIKSSFPSIDLTEISSAAVRIRDEFFADTEAKVSTTARKSRRSVAKRK